VDTCARKESDDGGTPRFHAALFSATYGSQYPSSSPRPTSQRPPPRPTPTPPGLALRLRDGVRAAVAPRPVRLRERAAPQRRLKLSYKAAYILYWYKSVRADATYRQCRRMIDFLCNEPLSPGQCSKELRRLGFTRKKLAHLSRRRDEAQRVSWWTSPPMPAVPGGPRGVRGLDTRLLIDIDEKPIWLHHCNRNYGHALSGQRGVVHRARDPREGRKATLLLVSHSHPFRVATRPAY
jgi:hypothetical protein